MVSNSVVNSSVVNSSVRDRIAAVLDPELPLVSIDDLGILREVTEHEDGSVEVVITPTYAGCPAMEAIESDIRAAVPEREVWVRRELSPAWTTDWISERGRATLAENGIAPPGVSRHAGAPVELVLSVRCPRCGSPETRELSRFGSTACKALWVCGSCGEPFDRFKEL